MQTSISQTNNSPLQFAKRPSKANHGRSVTLLTNFHRMQVQNKDGNIMKYSVKFEPEIADNARCRVQSSKGAPSS